MRRDIKPGATSPDDELPDHENVVRRLSEIQRDDPMMLTLARDLSAFHGWNRRTPPTPGAV